MDDSTEGMEPGRAMAALLARLDRHRRTYAQQMRLGGADLRILWLVADGRPRTLKEIAEELHLEQSTVNRQVNAALSEGLLERSRPEGGSAYVFTRTPHGHELFEADVARSLGAYRQALELLGEEDGPELLQLLARFVEEYGRAAESADAQR